MTSALATLGPPPDRQQEIVYTGLKIIGNGSFGVVYQARLVENNEPVAIKKVLQDKRFKNRELQIMRRLDHCNIIRLQYFYYSPGEKVRLVCRVSYRAPPPLFCPFHCKGYAGCEGGGYCGKFLFLLGGKTGAVIWGWEW